jgi:uncharacterized membrane protein SpoIIM required for sporulation
MKIGAYLKKRSENWTELERLNDTIGAGKTGSMSGKEAAKFSQHYRSACSDLAMSSEHKLPVPTVRYLHNLVARSHNNLYGMSGVALRNLAHQVFVVAPKKVLNDICVQISSVLFFGLFAAAALCAFSEHAFPGFAERVLGEAQIQNLENMYEEPIGSNVGQAHYIYMSARYIQNNTSIGLRCFGEGILILPCLYELIFNAVVLGASFGYMARESSIGGENFLQFVTAHGPFELTAISLSAAGGLRLGVGLFVTNGLKRLESLKLAAINAVPIIMSAVVLFILAAFTEGCISPTPLPYILKAMWAIVSSVVMMVYFVVLGSIDDGGLDATG